MSHETVGNDDRPTSIQNPLYESASFDYDSKSPAFVVNDDDKVPLTTDGNEYEEVKFNFYSNSGKY